MELIMLEKIFLRKEIVTEVEDNWKLPAQIIIYVQHIQVDIWGDAYSEQTLIQKMMKQESGREPEEQAEPLQGTLTPGLKGDRCCNGLMWHRAIRGWHQAFAFPLLPKHIDEIQHINLKHPLLPDCFALKTPLLSLPGHTCTNIAVFQLN